MIVIKKCIAKLCRSIRRCFEYLCVLDNGEAVKNIADTIDIGPLSKEEKIERETESLLQGVKPEDRSKVIKHLAKLAKEVDPLEGVDELPTNDILCNRE